MDIPTAPQRADRPALERVLALAPALVRFGAAVLARLPPSSRLRRWVLREAFSRGFAAINRWTPEHLIDLGDRWVVRLGMSASGRTSGARGHQTWGSVYHLSSGGRVARQDVYWTWQETLAAAELRVNHQPQARRGLGRPEPRSIADADNTNGRSVALGEPEMDERRVHASRRPLRLPATGESG